MVGILVALMVVGSTLFGLSPSELAFGGDPLSEAQAKQRELQEALASQRRQLKDLQDLSATLDQRLNAAMAELAAVSSEYERVAGLLVQVEAQIVEVTARLEALRARIATLDALLITLAKEIEHQNRDRKSVV